ncbi:RIP metalloprotease RseP [Cereibacter azotoformans]|uniref:Zinc metalloprotease n=1 Tax=Cereibacter azotoformans TaxID=43057 RepID=A0A2T5KCH4_9RHOB|nr:RIP metalloprotease RseP [Cereibacter azotoformans]AXQ94032.1 RIP metalloprotease RseP [Cereibacter sphaeroides]MBO4168167.1 RIP metalloprotease RseP [Cereibacter azotoformans]PTR20104.1 regulator of sigma E protease [Cereibacter azotoformans]UIJ29564.1 RIP metalloprotease RseP [Cereibacter azotoformans]
MDIVGLVPQFGGAVWTIIAFIVALSIVVAVHEYGHYIVGRWTGIHAEVFSLGMGPVIASRVDRRGTRWQLAALPFGGYVRFLGDADAASSRASLTVHQLNEQERGRTMHGAPLWARSATVAAGPLFNFALSILVFCGFFMVKGVATELPVVGQMKELPSAGQELEPGDRILSVNGQETATLADFVRVANELPPAPTADYRIERAGAELALTTAYPFPPVVDSVQAPSGAHDAGIEAGDVILSVNGAEIASFRELREAVGDTNGAPVTLTVWRAGETFEATLSPRRMDIPLASGGFETRWLIGLSGGLLFEPETRTPGPIEAMGLGIQQTYTVITTSLSGLWHMVTGAISSCNLQGPIGIAEISGAAASQGPGNFIWFIAMLSTAVGLMNLFPVPILDGGHLVFHAYEAVAGKPPSDRALRILMTGGLAMLLSLMVFAVTNDLFC